MEGFDMNVVPMVVTEYPPLELRSRIWSRLPEEVFIMIMARTSVKCIGRARTFNKQWSALVNSSEFLQASARIPRQMPCLILYDIHYTDQVEVGAYQPSSSLWYKISLDFLPFEEKLVGTAAGALFYVLEGGVECSSLYVCNPLTKNWRKTARMESSRYDPVVGVFELYPSSAKSSSASSSTYHKVIVAGDVRGGPKELSAEMYDPGTDSWQEIASLPSKLWSCIARDEIRTAVCGERFYVLASDKGLLAYYDLRAGVWSDLHALNGPQFSYVENFHIVVSNGILLLIGEAYDDNGKSVTIWMMDEGKYEDQSDAEEEDVEEGNVSPAPQPQLDWIEIGTLPQEILRSLQEDMNCLLRCIGGGGQIYLFNPPGSDSLLVACGDFSDKVFKWSLLPSRKGHHACWLRGVCTVLSMDTLCSDFAGKLEV